MTSSRSTDKQLEALAERAGINLVAIVTKDRLRYLSPKNGGYIINMQDSDDGFGTHWVALYIEGKQCAYFDSFGIDPPLQVLDFCNGKKMLISMDQYQDFRFGHCGGYCIAFLSCIEGGSLPSQPSLIKRYKRFQSIFRPA